MCFRQTVLACRADSAGRAPKPAAGWEGQQDQDSCAHAHVHALAWTRVDSWHELIISERLLPDQLAVRTVHLTSHPSSPNVPDVYSDVYSWLGCATPPLTAPRCPPATVQELGVKTRQQHLVEQQVRLEPHIPCLHIFLRQGTI